MTAQTKILDVQARNYDFIEMIPSDILGDVLELISSFLQKDE
jgi:hypothetical protein